MFSFLKYILLSLISIVFILFFLDKKIALDYFNFHNYKEHNVFIQYNTFDNHTTNKISLNKNVIFYNDINIATIENINISLSLSGLKLEVNTIHNGFKEAFPKVFKNINNISVSSILIDKKIKINFDNKFKCQYDFLLNNITCNKHNKIINNLVKGITQ